MYPSIAKPFLSKRRSGAGISARYVRLYTSDEVKLTVTITAKR